MTKRKIGWKNIRIMLIIGCIFCASSIWGTKIASIIKQFLSINELKYVIGGIATIITLSHGYINKKFAIKKDISLKQFHKIFEEFISIVGSPIALVCGFSLINGLSHEFWGDRNYFPFFDETDLSVLSYVSIYLIITSFMDLRSIFIEMVFNETSNAKEPLPIQKEKTTGKD